uniref:Uncharacterized protein n=1 Tax=uncultured Armatimonadetes bacterium TaxID=157466 RepID=A0A6J4I1R9_9BACT|nr:hypothetical protein AVDCRST_MAG63-1373 [uncultured Armatimonadetes bacterium]
MANEQQPGLVTSRPPGLVDLLDRILDKGLVIVGDIKVSLANVELLTLQIRLLICSIEKAEEIGINWWRFDPNLTVPAPVTDGQNDKAQERLPAPEPEQDRLDVPMPAAAGEEKTGATRRAGS